MRTKLTIVCAAMAFVAIAGGTAEATGLIHTANIANGAITFNKLSPHVQKQLSKKATGATYGNGLTGANGAKGDTGATGLQGAKGDTGPAGPQVVQSGGQGATGAKGDTGPHGNPGVQGDTGATGATGATGNTGAQGNPGAQGAAGTNGSDATVPGLIVTHVTGGDSNVCGDDWATDTYTRTLQILPQADGTISVIRTYNGTFVTIAGVAAPNGPCSASQTGGVTGTFTGFDVVSVTGGDYTPDATCAANCTGSAMIAAFFPGGTLSGPAGDAWDYHYDAGAHGSWVNAPANRGGNTGNITG